MIASAPTSLILDRLNGVIRSRNGWRAECPACGGSSKKLSIADAPDGSGKVLLKCFAGCPALDVVQAIGLTLAHLFPARLSATTSEERLAYRRALRDAGVNPAIVVLAHEANVVVVACFDVLNGKPFTPEDLARVELALQRVEDAKLVLCER